MPPFPDSQQMSFPDSTLPPFPNSPRVQGLGGAKPDRTNKAYVLVPKKVSKKGKLSTKPSIKRQNPIGLEYRHLGETREIDPRYFYVCNQFSVDEFAIDCVV